MMGEHAVIGADSSCQGLIRNVHHTLLCGALYCPLGLVQQIASMLGKNVRINGKLLLCGCEMGSLYQSCCVNFDMLV